MSVKFSNNGKTTVKATGNDFTVAVFVHDTSVFPTISGDDYFYVTLDHGAGVLEICKVTAVDHVTGKLTVERGQEGTTAKAFGFGTKVENRLTAGGLNDVLEQSNQDTLQNVTARNRELTTNPRFTEDEGGIEWYRNTDAASIKFYNDSDGDTNSRLEFNIRDNKNEFFLFTSYDHLSGSDTEQLKIHPTADMTFRGNKVYDAGDFTNNATNWDAAYSWGDHGAAGYVTTDTTYTAGNGLKLVNNVFKLKHTSVWAPHDMGNLPEHPLYFKVGKINKGNGGIHLKGTLNNHVESFGSCDFDLSIYGREGNDPAEIEVHGYINVAANNTGVLVVKSLDTESSYDHYDVYIALTRYSQVVVNLTPTGSSEIFTPAKAEGITTKPTSVDGSDPEFDSIDLGEGSYIVSNSQIYDNFHSGVFTNNATDWDTAYSWGDHGAAGYLTTHQDISGKANLSGNNTFTGSITARTFISTPQVPGGNVEGGEIKLEGAGTSEDVYIDNFSGDIRFFDSTQPQVRARLNTDGDLELTGELTASGYNNSNWDTAYGWGNHAEAGYLTSETHADAGYLTTHQDVSGKANLSGDNVFTGYVQAQGGIKTN